MASDKTSTPASRCSSSDCSKSSDPGCTLFPDSDVVIPFSSSPPTSSPFYAHAPFDETFAASDDKLVSESPSNGGAGLPGSEGTYETENQSLNLAHSTTPLWSPTAAEASLTGLVTSGKPSLSVSCKQDTQQHAYTQNFDGSSDSIASPSNLDSLASQTAFAAELDMLLLDVLRDQESRVDSASSSRALSQANTNMTELALVSEANKARSGSPHLSSPLPISGCGSTSSHHSSVDVLHFLAVNSQSGSVGSSYAKQDNETIAFRESTQSPSAPIDLSQDPRRLISSGLAIHPGLPSSVPPSIGAGPCVSSREIPLRTPHLTTPTQIVPCAPKKRRADMLPGYSSSANRILEDVGNSLGARTSISDGSGEVVPPSLKKRKVSHIPSTGSRIPEHGPPSRISLSHRHENGPQLYASKPASLRKAASLRSEPSPGRVDHENKISTWLKGIPEEEVFADDHREDPRQENFEQCPPTEPVTPAIKPCRTILGAASAISPFSSPLPIIAPPAYILIPRAPSGAEAVAEDRLVILLAKEQKERLSDSLPVLHDLQCLTECDDTGAKSCNSVATSDHFDQLDSDGSTDRDSPTENHLMDCTEDRTTSIDGDSAGGETVLEIPLGVTMAIQEDFRREVIEWILGLHPRPLKTKSCQKLCEQLSSHPDTRWHAAQLLTRFFGRLGTFRENTQNDRVIYDSSDTAFVWDITIACIALSVKFHRDVLHPLCPILADEFLMLAPHSISYEDFESAQREIFSTFSFCLGSSTPGAFIQELWLALPSLRKLLAQHGEWEASQRAAWETLSDALLDIDYLRFPVSLLTGCALVLGITDTLILKAKINSASALVHRSDRWRSRKGARCDCGKQRQVAQRIVKNVETDIRELLGSDEVRYVLMSVPWVRD